MVAERIPYHADGADTPSSTPSSSSRARSAPPSLYISGLGTRISKDDLVALFQRNGFHVRSARVVHDMNGAPRGFGFVDLASESDVTRALNSPEIFGEGIKVSIANRR